MSKYQVLYNPLGGNGLGATKIKELEEKLTEHTVVLHNVLEISDYKAFLDSLQEEDILVVAGGDGTLNRFVNNIEGHDFKNHVYYFPMGTGNDFLHDVAQDGEDFLCIDSYIRDLPLVEINGRSYRFLNGVGYGIDGYCCEVADDIRENAPNKAINYTGIAIKGLLFHYKPKTATITVDGVKHVYKKAWLAPTMNGRLYGGGMIATPDQNRLNAEGTVSVLVMYGKGKLKTLMVFPSIFKGEHVKHTEMVEVLTGHEITVEFDRPAAAQIDGETVRGVTRYHVTAKPRL